MSPSQEKTNRYERKPRFFELGATPKAQGPDDGARGAIAGGAGRGRTPPCPLSPKVGTLRAQDPKRPKRVSSKGPRRLRTETEPELPSQNPFPFAFSLPFSFLFPFPFLFPFLFPFPCLFLFLFTFPFSFQFPEIQKSPATRLCIRF